MPRCRKIILENEQKCKIFIIGGTGLYIKSFINGIAPIPDIPMDIRQEARSLSNQELYGKLEKYDPLATQKLHINDTQRLARAYEVVRYTGESIYALQQKSVSFLPKNALYQGIFLNPPRERLYQRIDTRFDQMVEKGALAEIKKIMTYDPNLSSMKAVGIPELISYLSGKISLEIAIEKAKQASRQYAKRQMTFFNNQFADFNHLA